MKSVLSSLNSAQAIDPELELILEAAIGRLQDGRAVNVDQLAAAHPEHAAQLRELLPAVVAMVRVGEAAAEPVVQIAAENGKVSGNGHASSLPHQQLGDFRLVRELGRGGMGTVFEAEQLSMGRRVALKVLPFAALAQEKSLQRFRNEVRAAAALDHPHIVSVYSVGEEWGVHFYAMQLIRGQTLAEIIWHLCKARNKDSSPPPGGEGPGEGGSSSDDAPTIDSAIATPPSTKKIEQARISTAADSRHTAEFYRSAARLGIQAAEALQHAHDLGVLHRDIKPSNLMIDREAQLYITDFGLARIEADAGMTMTGDIVGTLRYMAPEQALAKRVVIDHRADIYSLGATLYELLTLQPAFGETDRSDLLKQIAFEEPRPLRKLDRHIPAELETIVLKAMAKHPGERYQSAGRLADDLRAYLENRPIKAKAPTIVGRAKKWSRRHQPLVWSAGLSAAALVLISLGVLASSNMAISRERNDKTIALQDRTAALARAESNFNMVMTVIERLFDRVGNEQLAEVPQLDQLRKDVLDDALGFYEKLLAENPLDQKVQFAMARAYVRAALMRIEFANTSKFQRLYAVPLCDKAALILENLLRVEPANPLYRFELATALKQKFWCEEPGNVTRFGELFQSLVDEFPQEPMYRDGLLEYLIGADLQAAGRNDSVSAQTLARAMREAALPLVEKRLQAEVLCRLAMLRERQGLLNEAESAYRESLRIHKLSLEERPNYARGLEHAMVDTTRFGKLLAKRLRFAEAEEVLREAVRIGETAVTRFPAMTNFRWRADSAYTALIEFYQDQTHIEKAIELIAAIPTRDARDYATRSKFYDNLKRPDLATKEHEAAVVAWSQQIGRNPADAESFAGRGNAYVKLKQFDKALEDFGNAIAIDPTNAEYFGDRGSMFSDLKKYDQALADTSKAVELDPVHPYRWLNRGVAYADLNQPEKALESISQAIAVAPRLRQAWINRAVTYRKLQQFDKALLDANKCIELKPDDDTAWNLRADIYRSMNQLDKAVEDYSHALQLAPDTLSPRINRGNLYIRLGRYAEAMAEYEAVAASEQEFIKAVGFDGMAELLATAPDDTLRDGKRAVELATKACELTEYKHPGHVERLAAAHAEAGDFEKAIEWQQKTIELAKNDSSDFFKKLCARQLESYQAGKPWRISDDDK